MSQPVMLIQVPPLLVLLFVFPCYHLVQLAFNLNLWRHFTLAIGTFQQFLVTLVTFSLCFVVG